VARLGADEDPACRRAAGEALSALLSRVKGTAASRKVLALCATWCAGGSGSGGVGDDPRLRRAAMQTLGLAVISVGSGIHCLLRHWIPYNHSMRVQSACR
jgi:hypothetical protein